MGRQKTAHAYVCGRGHKKCQDRTYAGYKNGTTVIALADGAGSCEYSEKGAAIATKETVHYLTDHFYSFNKEELLVQIQSALRGVGFPYESLASTLLFSAVNEENSYIVGHLGDGVIGECREGKYELLSKPDNGEFANTTYFTTSASALEHLRIYQGETTEGFILMSDGSAESLWHKTTQSFAPATGKFYEWLAIYPSKIVRQAIKKALREVVCLKTTDDCSVAILQIVKTKNNK